MSAYKHPPGPEGFPAQFVAEVLDDALAHDCRVYGIAGLQGSGKSTLAAQMAALAGERGLHVVVLSIDDFYLGRRDRLRLGRNAHPLLATRGPPGSHDIRLARGTIDALVAGKPTALPRFDKIADRRLPPSRWSRVAARADLIVLEGWFLKAPPEDRAALREPVNALERDSDPQGIWREYCNLALAAYAPLWKRIDRLLFLQGPGFEIVPDWRWQQELALQAAQPQRKAMDRRAVERFVLFFERISRHASRSLPTIADRTIRIDRKRQPIA